jgi:hypothetical protein
MTATLALAPTDPEILGLEPAQARAALLLASGLSITKVGELVGADRKTIYFWRQQPVFAAVLARELAVQSQLMRECVHAELIGLAEEAMDIVRGALRGGDPARALAAARIILARAEPPELQQLPAMAMPRPTQKMNTPELIARARKIRGERTRTTG